MIKPNKITTALAVALIAFSGSAAEAITGLSGVNSRTITEAPFEFDKILATGESQSNIPRSDATANITIHVTKSSDQVYYAAGMLYVGDDNKVYGFFGQSDADSYVLNNGSRNIQAPAGKNTLFCALGFSNDQKKLIVVQKYITVTEGLAVDLDYATATHCTYLKRIAPGGEEISFANKNILSGDNIMAMEYMDYFITDWSMTLFQDGMSQIMSNQSDGVKFIQFQVSNTTKYGILSALVPVDLTADAVGSDGDNWQVAEITGAPTPINLKYAELFPGNPYTMGRVMTLIDKSYRRINGVGVYGNCNAGKVGLWKPKDYKGQYNIAALPLLDPLNGDLTSINGQPIFMGENGLQQAGLNMYFNMGYGIKTSATPVFANSNPRYQRIPTTQFGNYAPVLVTVPTKGNAFTFTFAGHWGEEYTIDNFDIFERYPQNLAEKYNMVTNCVVIKRDGQEVVSDRRGFTSFNDWQNGKYEIEISTDNIIIDGNIKGLTKGTLEYTGNGQNQPLPTVNALQFRNLDDDVSDRFAIPSDGRVCVYAGAMYARETYPDGTNVFGNAGVKSITLEYSATGENTFEALEVKPDHSKDFMPGFGEYYEASLASVSQVSENKWYDLRITVTDNNDSKQVQTIAPAFQIEQISGVGVIGSDNCDPLIRVEGRDIVCDGNAKIYNATGALCGSKNLTPGLYVVTIGKYSKKIIIK